MSETEKLIELIKENPELPIVPMVYYEVVGEDYGYWMGKVDSVRIEEYLIDSWYGDDCVRFKSDEDDDLIIEGIAEIEFGDCTNEENWKKAEEKLKGLWEKAIIVYISD